jgi:predicted CopG family antitoxin
MSKRTTIRIPDDLYTRLIDRAKSEQRTISNLVIFLLNQSMNVATSGTAQPTSTVSPHPNAELQP